MATFDNLPGVDRVEYAVDPPALLRDDGANFDGVGRFQFQVFLNETDAIPSEADISATTFEIRVGYDNALDNEDGARYTVVPAAVASTQLNALGTRVASFTITANGGSEITAANMNTWAPAGEDVITTTAMTADAGAGVHSAVYDIAVATTAAATPWDTLGTARIPLAAMPDAVATDNGVYNLMNLGSSIRPRVPVQTTFDVTSLEWSNGGGVGVLTGTVEVDVTTAAAADAATASGIPAFWITLGGHGDITPQMFAVSSTGVPLGNPTFPVLPGQGAISPLVDGNRPLEYLAAGSPALTYQFVQVTTLTLGATVGNIQTMTFTLDVPPSAVQSPDLRITNITYAVGNRSLVGTVDFVNAMPSAIWPAASIGPIEEPLDTEVLLLSANTVADMPALLMGASLEPATLNGGAAGFAVGALVSIPGAAAADPAFDPGITLEAGLCPRGTTPAAALFDTATPLPLSLATATVQSVQLPPVSVGLQPVGMTSLYLFSTSTGDATLRRAQDMLPAVLWDAVTPVSDGRVVDLCIRQTPTGFGTTQVINLTPVPVSVAWQAATQDTDGAAAPTVTVSGVIDWADEAVPPPFRPLLTAPADITAAQFNAYVGQTADEEEAAFVGQPELAQRRVHPDTSVLGIPTIPDISRDTPGVNPTVVNMTSSADGVGVNSFITEEQSVLLGLAVDPQVAAMDATRYYVQYAITAATFTSFSGPAAVNVFPLMIGTPVLTAASGVQLFLHADSPTTAATPLLLEETPGVLPEVATFTSAFSGAAPAADNGVIMVPAEADPEAPQVITLELTPAADFTGPLQSASEPFPVAIDASTLSQFTFGVRPVLFTGPVVSDNPTEPRYGASLPVTPTFNAVTGNVDLQVAVTVEAVDALQHFKTPPRQVIIFFDVDVTFAGVRLTRPGVTADTAVRARGGSRVAQASAPTFIDGALDTEGTVQISAEYTLLNYGVGLSPSITPASVGVLTPAIADFGNISAVAAGGLYPLITPNAVAVGDTRPPVAPAAVLPDAAGVTLSGVPAETDPTLFGLGATDVLWDTGVPSAATSVVGSAAAGNDFLITSTLDFPIVSPTGDPLSFYVLSVFMTDPVTTDVLLNGVFALADLIVPIDAFSAIAPPSPSPPSPGPVVPGPVVPGPSTGFLSQLAAIAAQVELVSARTSLFALADAVEPAVVEDATEDLPATTAEMRDALLRKDGTGKLTRAHASLMSAHITRVVPDVNQDLRTYVLANAVTRTEEELNRALGTFTMFDE